MTLDSQFVANDAEGKPSPVLEHAFDIRVDFDRRIVCGPICGGGQMGFVGVGGGTIHGPRLNGRVVPMSGGDLGISQAELVKTLASPGYMSTSPDTGTTPSNAMTGISRYVQEHGYICQRLEYAGWRPLQRRWLYAAVAPAPSLNWIKSAVAAPNGTAWLEIGYYIHGDTSGQWRRVSGHSVVVVGYGTDGTRTDARILLVDNPAIGAMLPATAEQRAMGMKWRPVTLADQAITLTPTGPFQLFGVNSTTPRNVSQVFQVDGPGVPFSHTKYAAAFLDGALVLVIGLPS